MRQLKWQVFHRQVERMLLDKIGAIHAERTAKSRDASPPATNGTTPASQE